MNSKTRAWAQALFLAVILGCGGGGGGGGGSGGSGGGVSVNLLPSSATVGLNGQVPMRATVSGTSNGDVTWSVSAGSIISTGLGTALYTAPGTVQSSTVTATSVANPSKSDTSTISTAAGTATVSGRVLRSGTSFGISGVRIEFRDVGGAILSTVNTDSAGLFAASVSPSAVRFHLTNSTIPAGYYKQYSYNSLRYATTITTCSAPLPALTAGGSFPLATNIAVSATSGPPPPPPNGCPP